MIDSHTHTLASLHAYSTLEENVRAAAELGTVEGIGMTDHYSSMVKYHEGYAQSDYQFLINLKVLPQEWHGIRVYRGVEADIVDLCGNLYGFDQTDRNGNPVNKYLFKDAEYLIVSVHGKSEAMRAADPMQAAEMYCKAIAHPKAAIIGHMVRSAMNPDFDTVLKEVKALGKAIEVNESSYDYAETNPAGCRALAERCAALGVQVAVGSDAHIATRIGHVERAETMLQEIGFPKELIVTRSRESFDAFLAGLKTKGVCAGKAANAGRP